MGIFLEDTRIDSKKETIYEFIENTNYIIYSLNETILNSEIAYNNILIKSINEEYSLINEDSNEKIKKIKEKIKNWVIDSKKIINNLIDKIKEISINLFSKIASKFGLLKKYVNNYSHEILNYNGEDIKINVNNWKNNDIISCKRIYEINALKMMDHFKFNGVNGERIATNAKRKVASMFGDSPKTVDNEIILGKINKAKEDLLGEGTKEITISKNDSKLRKDAYDNILNYESDVKKLKILLDVSYKIFLECDKDLKTILRRSDELNNVLNADDNFREEIRTLKDKFSEEKSAGTLRMKTFSIILGLTNKILSDSFKIVKTCVNNYNKENSK